MKTDMDLMALMTSRIDEIMDSVGSGMKVLLMDSDTTTSVSLSCPQSRIMKKEVFLFEILHSRPPEKSNLSYLKCVALVKPTSENIRLLAREVASPRYGSYYIFFTNRVKRADLKSLAEADGNEVVSDLKEIPSDFLVFESHVFTTKLPTEMPFPVKNLQWNKENSALQRCTDSLRSLILALKATKANICYLKESMLSQELANGIKDEINQEGSRDTTLVILDRRIDPITPLLNQWTYQAMIHELIGIHNNTVDLQGRPDVPDEMKKMTLSADLDEFYRLNMYVNFGEIGTTIQNLVKSFQEKVKIQKKLDSINDIKDFVNSYPEFKKMSGTVSKHTHLVSELSNEVKINGLLDVSELEQNIACGSDNKLEELLHFLKEKPTIRPKDALRLIALYTIRYGKGDKLRNLCKSVKGVSEKEVYDVIENVSKFSRIKSRYLFGDESSASAFTPNFFKGLKGAENVYTQHQPLITKGFLPDIIRGKQRPDFNYLRPQVEATDKVIVYVIGGITYEESRAVAMFNKENGSNVVLGGTSILNYDSYIKSINEAC